MKMNRLSMMVQDGTFKDYKLAVMTADLYDDKAFRYRGETIPTDTGKLEVEFVETFIDSIKAHNDDHISRQNNIDQQFIQNRNN